MTDAPKGVVAVLINSRGQTMCAVADFDNQGFGGFTLKEAQRIRARSKLADKFVTEFCVPDMAAVLLGSKAESLLGDLQRRFDWKIHTEEVNWGSGDD